MHRVSGCYGDGSVSVSHSFRIKTKRALLADADRVPFRLDCSFTLVFYHKDELLNITFDFLCVCFIRSVALPFHSEKGATLRYVFQCLALALSFICILELKSNQYNTISLSTALTLKNIML